MTAAFPDAVQSLQLPRVVRLTHNLWAASFALMKLVPARFVLQRAQERGELGPDCVVIESTSGTFGLGLAMQAALMQRQLVLVTDPVMDAALCRRVSDLGATVHVCREPAAVGGYQTARLARLHELAAELPQTFWPRQYDNPDNPASYAVVAEHLRKAIGSVECLVGAVGSGGSMCGTLAGLRRHGDTYGIAVDTHFSVLFGQADGPRPLRGLGNSVMPTILDHTAFDEVHWCTSAEATASTRDLHRRHALFQGPTSGAAFRVAAWWAAQNPSSSCVVMLPDDGTRYLDTVYDDAWVLHESPDRAARLLPAQGGPPAPEQSGPRTVEHPAAAGPQWSRMRWGRRRLDEVAPGSTALPTA
jgi:cysteine synthase